MDCVRLVSVSSSACCLFNVGDDVWDAGKLADNAEFLILIPGSLLACLSGSGGGGIRTLTVEGRRVAGEEVAVGMIDGARLRMVLS